MGRYTQTDITELNQFLIQSSINVEKCTEKLNEINAQIKQLRKSGEDVSEQIRERAKIRRRLEKYYDDLDFCMNSLYHRDEKAYWKIWKDLKEKGLKV